MDRTEAVINAKVQPPRFPKRRNAAKLPRESYWQRFAKQKASVFCFVAKLGALTGLYYCFAATPWYGSVLVPYLDASARVAHFILAGFGNPSNVSGPTVWSARYSVTILPACSASEFIAFFCAAVLVFPTGWLQRMVGLAFGVIAIGLLNEVRLASVFWTGDHFGNVANIVHEEIWPPLLVIAMILLYAAWLRWALRTEQKSANKAILGFSLRLVVVYLLLLPPWPLFSDAYGVFFKSLGETVFAESNTRQEFSFETPADSQQFLPMRVVIVNQSLMARDGSGPVRNLDFSAWDFGWRPTMLNFALILATPIPWSRRWLVLIAGCALIHLLMLITLRVCIWTESAEIGLLTFTPPWRMVAAGLREALITQLSFAGPVLVWLLVTFRREDGAAILGSFRNAGGSTSETFLKPWPLRP